MKSNLKRKRANEVLPIVAAVVAIIANQVFNQLELPWPELMIIKVLIGEFQGVANFLVGLGNREEVAQEGEFAVPVFLSFVGASSELVAFRNMDLAMLLVVVDNNLSLEAASYKEEADNNHHTIKHSNPQEEVNSNSLVADMHLWVEGTYILDLLYYDQGDGARHLLHHSDDHHLRGEVELKALMGLLHSSFKQRSLISLPLLKDIYHSSLVLPFVHHRNY